MITVLLGNKPLFDAVGITAWHNAGYTGKNGLTITYEQFAYGDLFKDNISTQFGDMPAADTHGLGTASAHLQVAPDRKIVQINDNAALIPWIMEHKPDIGFRSLSDSAFGFDAKYTQTLPFLSLFNAAGNDDVSGYASRIIDNCWFGVGAVTYSHGAFLPAGYSSVSEYVDFCGLTDIRIPYNNGGAFLFTGTSCATPVIAGMCALVNDAAIQHIGRPLSHDEMYEFIVANCKDLGAAGHDTKTGHGIFILPPPDTVDWSKYKMDFKIIEEQYVWNGELVPRDPCLTDYLVLHHAAGDGSAQDIHRIHVEVKGWRGIAYNYYIRKDGSIYRGRPEYTYGGHTADHHGDSLGICFEGNFETEQMSTAQKDAGKWLVKEITARYPDITVCRHSDLNATACPGKYFPFDAITAQEEIEMRYNTITEIPEWGKPTIQKLIDRGALKGTGTGFDISADMLRMFVINDRMGIYG